LVFNSTIKQLNFRNANNQEILENYFLFLAQVSVP